MTKQWRYEPKTLTIRSIPENYWICTMDSWDKAVDNEANARLISMAPAMYEALKEVAETTSIIRDMVLDKAQQVDIETECVGLIDRIDSILAEIE